MVEEAGPFAAPPRTVRHWLPRDLVTLHLLPRPSRLRDPQQRPDLVDDLLAEGLGPAQQHHGAASRRSSMAMLRCTPARLPHTTAYLAAPAPGR